MNACPRCNGRGRQVFRRRFIFGDIVLSFGFGQCRLCRGTGYRELGGWQ